MEKGRKYGKGCIGIDEIILCMRNIVFVLTFLCVDWYGQSQAQQPRCNPYFRHLDRVPTKRNRVTGDELRVSNFATANVCITCALNEAKLLFCLMSTNYSISFIHHWRHNCTSTPQDRCPATMFWFNWDNCRRKLNFKTGVIVGDDIITCYVDSMYV